MNAQRERKLGKFDSFRKLSFFWRTLFERLSHNSIRKKREEAEMSDK